MKRLTVLLLEVVFFAQLTALAGCDSDSSAASGAFGDLGRAASATLRGKALNDGVYLRISKSVVYNPDVCGATVSGGDIVEAMSPRFYRVSFDGTTVTEFTPTQPVLGENDFAPVIGGGAAIASTLSIANTSSSVYLSLFDGAQTIEVTKSSLTGPDAGRTEAESPSSQDVLDLIAEPTAQRVYFIDDIGRLRKFETGSRRTIATVDVGFRFVSINATQVTLARVDTSMNTLIVEQHSLTDGALIGTSLVHTLTQPALSVVPRLSNGTPSDARIFVERNDGDTFDVVRLTNTTLVEELAVGATRVDARLGDVAFVATLVDATIFRFDAEAEATLLAKGDELGTVACREDPEVRDRCGRRQFCRGARAVSGTDGPNGMAFLYESAFPADTRVSVSTTPPRSTDEVTSSETFPVRVLSLVRPADWGDDTITMPTVVVRTEEPVTGSPVEVGELAFGQEMSFVEVPLNGGASGEGLILDVDFVAGGDVVRVVLDPVEIMFQAAVAVTLVVWQEPGLAPGYELFWHNTDTDSLRGATALILQSDTNAGTGFAWFREESFDACEEAFCHEVECMRVERSRMTGDVMTGLGPPALTAPIRARTRLVYSATAIEGATECEGEVLYEQLWQSGDGPASRVIVAHALAPSDGADVVHFEGGLP